MPVNFDPDLRIWTKLNDFDYRYEYIIHKSSTQVFSTSQQDSYRRISEDGQSYSDTHQSDILQLISPVLDTLDDTLLVPDVMEHLETNGGLNPDVATYILIQLISSGRCAFASIHGSTTEEVHPVIIDIAVCSDFAVHVLQELGQTDIVTPELHPVKGFGPRDTVPGIEYIGKKSSSGSRVHSFDPMWDDRRDESLASQNLMFFKDLEGKPRRILFRGNTMLVSGFGNLALIPKPQLESLGAFGFEISFSVTKKPRIATVAAFDFVVREINRGNVKLAGWFIPKAMRGIIKAVVSRHSSACYFKSILKVSGLEAAPREPIMLLNSERNISIYLVEVNGTRYLLNDLFDFNGFEMQEGREGITHLRFTKKVPRTRRLYITGTSARLFGTQQSLLGVMDVSDCT